MAKLSWKTSLGGSMTATGSAMMGITILTALFSKFGSHAMEVYVERHIGVFFWTAFIGFLMTCAGPLVNGFAGRDNQVTSEDVQASGIQPKPQVLVELPPPAAGPAATPSPRI